MDYEGHICRAPMERASFMLPVMVGCSYNRCKFCTLFRRMKYRVLPLDQVEEEIKRVADVGGCPKKIFLGDGNAFALPMDHLRAIVALIRKYFPDYEMINADATVTSIMEKTDEELQELADAGFRHLYLGVESGLDDVLEFMDKDHTNPEAMEAIKRIQGFGMYFDAHIMSGIAGAGRGEENALALAAFMNEAKPKHVCNFSLFLHKEAPLFRHIESGEFVPADELSNLMEDRILIENLFVDAEEGESMRYEGFHDMLQIRIHGELPRDREKMLARIDQLIAQNQDANEKYSWVCGDCPTFFTPEGIQIYTTTVNDR